MTEIVKSPEGALDDAIKTRQDGAVIRETCLKDYAAIAALHNRHGLSVKSYADWEALLPGNPSRTRDDKHRPIGWVVEAKNGDIVGSIGNILLEYEFKQRTIRAATPCGWAVDPRYRGFSIALLNRFLNQHHINLFIFATVSPSAEPIFQSFRFHQVPVGSWDKSVFWVTKYEELFRSAFTRRSISRVALAKWAFTIPVSLARYFASRRASSNSAFEIGLCQGFDSRFDAFWQELRRQNEVILTAVRTREILAWHFRSALSQNRAWILTASKGSRLGAYAIADMQDNPALGLKRVRLVDLQTLKGFEETLPLLLARIRRICRQQSVHIFEITGNWLDRPQWPQIRAPYERKLPSWAYYYKTPDRELSEILKHPEVWAPSSFDGDASL